MSRPFKQTRDAFITEPLHVEKFIPGGQALATLASGKKVFLWGALPDEVVTRARITKEKSSFVEAIAEDISQPSSHRVAPLDPCYLSTSPWQLLDYDYELTEKAALLSEIYRQQGIDLSAFALAFQTDGRDYHYRNKMEYALYYSHVDAKIHLAFHDRGSHRKTPIERSSLERPEIWQQASRIVDELNQQQADARAYQSLLLRCNQDGTVSGGLLENHRTHPRFAELSDTILGQTYSYSPNGFFQVNLPVYEMALREIARHIQSQAVLDLYSGVGTIGLSVARGRHLTLVECDHSAYRELEHNVQNLVAADASQAALLHPVLARSEDALEYIAPDQTVILDPPRAGCAPKLIERLLAVVPPTIIYLSCNPITQARDVQRLAAKYRIVSLTPFNFFPHTPHLENLVVLEAR